MKEETKKEGRRRCSRGRIQVDEREASGDRAGEGKGRDQRDCRKAGTERRERVERATHTPVNEKERKRKHTERKDEERKKKGSGD